MPCKNLKNNILTLLAKTFAIALVFHSYAMADGVVQSDFVFQLDQKVFNTPEFNFVSKLNGTENVELGDRVIQDEAPVQVKGLKAQISYKIASGTPNIFLGAEQNFASTKFSMVLTIDELNVDAVVERIVNGVLIRARVKGNCRNVTATLPEGKGRIMGSILTSVGEAGLPQVSLPWFDVLWAAGSWQLSDFSCEGVAGFKDKVVSGLTRYLDDSSQFTSEFKKEVDAKIAVYQTDAVKSFLEERPLDLDLGGARVVLKPKAIRNLQGEKFQVLGQIDFVFGSSTVNEIVKVTGSQAANADTARMSLMLPDTVMSALNAMSVKTGNYRLRKNGEDIAAFKDLQNSPTSQTFVWPELSYYAADAKFLFDFNALDTRMSAIRDLGNGVLYAGVETRIDALVWAPVSTKYVRMLRMNTPVEGVFRTWISQDASGVGNLNLKFETAGIALLVTWEDEYLPIRRTASFGVGTFQRSITEALTVDGVSFSLGKFNLTESMSLTPAHLSKNGPWLTVLFK